MSLTVPRIVVCAGRPAPVSMDRAASLTAVHSALAVLACAVHASGARWPSSVLVSASSPARASATSMVPACLAASNAVTLRLTNRTSGSANTVREAVVKSDQRVPMPSTTSASAASAFAAWVPVEPRPPTARGWSNGIAPLPACVSATGIPVASAKSTSAALGVGVVRRRRRRPPAAAAPSAAPRPRGPARPRPAPAAADVPGAFGEQLLGPVVGLGLDVLRQREVTAPVVAGSVRARMAPSRAVGQLLGAVHPVEEHRDGAQGVVDRDAGIARVLELLQHARPRPGWRRCRRAAAGPGAG